MAEPKWGKFWSVEVSAGAEGLDERLRLSSLYKAPAHFPAVIVEEGESLLVQHVLLLWRMAMLS